ncbi:MAG: alpha/beta hydrolase [Novosphingobium sp.]|nr:alpha/beta hydrolase [Novosphingobium sp.]
MTAIALPSNDLFSVITTGGGDRRASWRSLLGLPDPGSAHVAFDSGSQRGIWAARLDEAVLRADKPVLLVANGESCFAAAWWARLSPASYVSRVAGALLVDPLGRSVDPEAEERFISPRIALPFPSAVLSGSARRGEWIDRIEQLAEGWGSGVARTSDGSAWEQAQDLILRATARVVERRMRVAETLGFA